MKEDHGFGLQSKLTVQRRNRKHFQSVLAPHEANNVDIHIVGCMTFKVISQLFFAWLLRLAVTIDDYSWRLQLAVTFAVKHDG